MAGRHLGGASQDFAKFLLRASLALLMLLHGVAKIFGGIGPIMGMLAKAGVPPSLGYLVYLGEVIAPLLVLLGIWTRPAAWIIAINMVVAIWLAHLGDLFRLTPTGGWALELQALYLASAVAVALLGAGRYSVGGTAGRWN